MRMLSSGNSCECDHYRELGMEYWSLHAWCIITESVWFIGKSVNASKSQVGFIMLNDHHHPCHSANFIAICGFCFLISGRKWMLKIN